jgi:hypothetical protein
LFFAAFGFAGLVALAGSLGLVLPDDFVAAAVFATVVFATGMTQNLKQRAYNHNSQKEEGREINGNHKGRDENPEQ